MVDLGRPARGLKAENHTANPERKIRLILRKRLIQGGTAVLLGRKRTLW